MKLHISENIDKVIDGFTIVPIVYGEVDLATIPSNCASEIIAIDAVDSISHDKIEQFIFNVCSKIRLNGTAYFGGLDVYALSRSLLSGNISIKEYNDFTSKSNAIYSSKYILSLLQSNDITIQSVVYKGNYYEITVKRTHNKN